MTCLQHPDDCDVTPMRVARHLLALGLLLISAATLIAADPPTLGRGGVAPVISEIPEGPLRRDLEGLGAVEQAAALTRLVGVPAADVDSLRAGASGHLCYLCKQPAGALPVASSVPEVAPVVSLAALEAPSHHSRPGAPNIIYLCFVGGTVFDTQWNIDFGSTTVAWKAKPLNLDGDATSFSQSEKNYIAQVWRRVAEDYAPFDVDVTTEAPESFNNRTAWVLITPDIDANGRDLPHRGYGGIAYLDVFGDINYHAKFSPAWVTVTTNPANAAEAASHEVGHNLGLSHDGTTKTPPGQDQSEYYYGHPGSISAPSWAPIMGAGYGKSVTQWSKGEYYLANNPEDDLAIITDKLNYIPDLGGHDAASAKILTSDAFIVEGIISKSSLPDVYRISVGSGTIAATALTNRDITSATGGNLDLQLDVYSDAGLTTRVGTANPSDNVDATLSVPVPAGTYYLVVRPVGSGTPAAATPSGYTTYAVIGKYTLSGFTRPAGPVLLVQGNSRLIRRDDDSPSSLDGTLIGTVGIGGRASRTFTLLNDGDSVLTLNGESDVSIVGDPDLQIESQPAATTLRPRQSTTFIVSGEGLSLGTKRATVTVFSNQPEKPTYSFGVALIDSNEPPPLAPVIQETGGGGGCGAGGGLAVLLGFLVLRLRRQSRSR